MEWDVIANFGFFSFTSIGAENNSFDFKKVCVVLEITALLW